MPMIRKNYPDNWDEIATENLVALCPKCHLWYDEIQRLARKRIKAELANVLFKGG